MLRGKIRKSSCLLVVVMTVLAACHVAWASPSGLNNIPTTDVVPEKVVVLQTWLNMTEEVDPQQYVGFKTSFLKGLEFGVDWKAIDEVHGHATLQAKYAFNIVPDFLKGVVGVANVSDNRQHQGEVFPYAALSLDIELFRLHFGYAAQPHNEAFFAGIDRTFLLFDRNLQLKADAIQTNDKNDMLLSAGFLYEFGRQNADQASSTKLLSLLDELTKNMILEAWVTFPTTGGEETYTIKMNYVIKF